MSSLQWAIHKKVPTQGPEISKFMYHWVQGPSQAADMNSVVHLWIVLEGNRDGFHVPLSLTEL